MINVVVNNVRRENNYDYILLFLSLDLDNDLRHANIILYDIKNLTIERFEPYGSDIIKSEIDELLEESLTWNTGFKYLSPNDYLPKPGYQLLANENDLLNLKIGDFGGFCLVWCIWYVEHRIKNPTIDLKSLNKKTLEKLLQNDNSLSEFIRNYSNKLFEQKINIIKKIEDINPNNNISNLYLTINDEEKINNHIEEFFSLV